jgi:hypothetical protein
MTSREKTALLSIDDDAPSRPLSEKLFTVAWGAIQWPWLARSLWGGKLADKHALLDRLGLPHDALPHLGSWKADTYFLWRMVEAIERLRPREVVELGCGASTLVLAKALERNGGGRLTSYDQHPDFVEATGRCYISLVPTQLARSRAAGGWDVLAGFDAVLVGGGPLTPDLLVAAKAAGINVVTTYGMAETCGGVKGSETASDGYETTRS